MHDGITYESALEIARKANPEINHCMEYTSAFAFTVEADVDADGGIEPVVVLKDDGRIEKMFRYAMAYPDKELIRSFDI